ncbi:MAG: hypothetical protein ABI812_00140 [Betaproteobacteria bacterium]
MSSSDARAAPSAFGEAEARAFALAWIRRQWLASPALSRHARSGPIESLSLPFWLIDAYAVAHWEGPALRGIIEMDFGALAVCAEPSVDSVLMETLEPWPLAPLRPHDAHPCAAATPATDPQAAATGSAPTLYSLDDARARARRRMERDLIATARRGQPAAVRERMRLLGVEYPREACDRAQLPLWQFDDLRFGRRWRIAVNGTTGKAAGRALFGVVR